MDVLKDVSLYVDFRSRTITTVHTGVEHPPSSYLNIPKLNTQVSPIPVLCHQAKMMLLQQQSQLCSQTHEADPVVPCYHLLLSRPSWKAAAEENMVSGQTG